MCKLFTITGIRNSYKAWELLWQITPSLTNVDDDGFGYAAFSKQYGIIGERWHPVKHAWLVHGGSMSPPQGLEEAGESPTYNKFGNWPNGKVLYRPKVTSITAHARRSTNRVCLANVHPFYKNTAYGEIALSHNGMISNHAKLDLSGSDGCDSAGIMNKYIEHGVFADAKAIQPMVDDLTGWYACTVLWADSQGAHVDIFKSASADLHFLDLPEVGIVWCTSAHLVLEAAKALDLTVAQTWTFKTGVLSRFDAVSGVTESITPFRLYAVTSGGGGTSVVAKTETASNTSTGGRWQGHRNHHGYQGGYPWADGSGGAAAALPAHSLTGGDTAANGQGVITRDASGAMIVRRYHETPGPGVGGGGGKKNDDAGATSSHNNVCSISEAKAAASTRASDDDDSIEITVSDVDEVAELLEPQIRSAWEMLSTAEKKTVLETTPYTQWYERMVGGSSSEDEGGERGR